MYNKIILIHCHDKFVKTNSQFVCELEFRKFWSYGIRVWICVFYKATTECSSVHLRFNAQNNEINSTIKVVKYNRFPKWLIFCVDFKVTIEWRRIKVKWIWLQEKSKRNKKNQEVIQKSKKINSFILCLKVLIIIKLIIW